MIESEMARGIWVSRSEAEATTLYEALKRYEEEIFQAKKVRRKSHPSSRPAGRLTWRSGH
ncbi:hypothetical protein LGN21_24770 [Burkholderia cepacia]|nr:hypothetical protein [Burkholderia cepacia]MCA8282810.1 hypothetical protein [Burkholderia cepacia]